MRIFLTAALIFLSAFRLCAQKADSTQKFHVHFIAEALGIGGGGSLQLEFSYQLTGRMSINLRGGIGSALPTYQSFVPVAANVQVGRRKLKAEFGLGHTLHVRSYSWSTQRLGVTHVRETYHHYHALIGMRWYANRIFFCGINGVAYLTTGDARYPYPPVWVGAIIGFRVH